jgi:pimeloyl-ACP methyl ester carboxylesterase
MEKGARDQVRFLAEFVEAVALEEQFYLGGNSQGAQMGASYAVEYPDRVKRMVLISSPAFHRRLGLEDLLSPQALRARGAGDRPPDYTTEEGMRRQMERLVYNPSNISDELVKMRTLSAVRCRESFEAGRAYSRRELEDPNLFQAISFVGRLDKLTIPTIHISGKEDTTLPYPRAQELERILPNIKFYYPSYCGHQAQTDRPVLVGRMILEWFRDGRISAETERMLEQQEPVPAAARA